MSKDMTLGGVAAVYGWDAHGRAVDALAESGAGVVAMRFLNPKCTRLYRKINDLIPCDKDGCPLPSYAWPDDIRPFDTVRVIPEDTLIDASYVQNAKDKMKEKTMAEQPTMHSAHTVRCGDCEYYRPAAGEVREQCRAPHNMAVKETWDHVKGLTRVERSQQPPKMVNANGTCPWHKSKPAPRAATVMNGEEMA